MEIQKLIELHKVMISIKYIQWNYDFPWNYYESIETYKINELSLPLCEWLIKPYYEEKKEF